MVVGLVVRRVGSLRSDVDVGGINEGGVSIFHRAWSHSEKKGTLDLVLESLLFYTSGSPPITTRSLSLIIT